jgi:ATP-dependent Lhr-like helicase
VRIAGEERWIAAEDAGSYRDALGVSPPIGVPEAFLRPSADPLRGLLLRYARTHVPFLAEDPALRWALPAAMVAGALRTIESGGGLLHGDFRPGGTRREWCDPEVLRIIRRRSLARLRKDVEPVSHAAFARFLARWHGIGSARRDLDRVREAVAQCEGYPLPASVLERDVLSARVAGYQPRLLDELGAAGEVAWTGRGPLGKDDGRLALYRREHLSSLALPASVEVPQSPAHQAIVECLRSQGASFFADLVAATGGSPRDTLDALWDLVWAGLVTNDTLAPVRALAWPRRQSGTPRGRGSLVPPDAVGRWSLTRAGRGQPPPEPTAAAHALAEMLLERYGVVTRESVTAEGIPGGFSAVYPVLKAMEEGGRVRRGYFVEGLGGAQFALPGVVDRLRADRDESDEPIAHLLAATDPASPYGAAVPWPLDDADRRRALQRAAGAYVVLVNGEPAVYVERGGRGLMTLPRFDDPGVAAAAIDELRSLAGRRPRQSLTLERIDGLAAADSPCALRFIEAGFATGYRGLTYRWQDSREAVYAGR